jgi:hypothetical protein
VSASRSVGAPATLDGLAQFKMRVDYCSGTLHDREGRRVADRAGLVGTLNVNSLGRKN